MTIQSNFPNLSPSLDLNFAATKTLSPLVTFTRASTATYYGTQTAKAEENLVLRSQEFDLIWALERVTLTANSTNAPDSTMTADTITNTTALGTHVIQQSSSVAGFSVVSGHHYTLSVFAKKNTNDFLQITTFSATNTLGTGRANFNLATGVVGSVDGGTSAIKDEGNGWYRCSYTVTASASGNVTVYFGIITTSTAARFESYTGLGTESVYLWGAQLEQRSAVTAYTPTTTQPITNYIPVLQTALAGVPRFDHNPTTFESLGFLVEELRSNLMTYSEDYTQWTKTNVTVQSNVIVAPNGTLTGSKLINNNGITGGGAFGNNGAYRNSSLTSGSVYTFSVYAKAGENVDFGISIADTNFGTGGAQARFNLSTTSMINTNSTSKMEAVGNGWYRCIMTTTNTLAVTGTPRCYLFDTTTGNGFNGIYVWGAQLE